MTDLLHPEKALLREGSHYSWCQSAIKELEKKFDVKDPNGFYGLMEELKNRLVERSEKFVDNAEAMSWLFTAYNRALMERVFEDYEDDPSYSRVVLDPRFKICDRNERMQFAQIAIAAGVDPTSMEEVVFTEYIVRHAVTLWRLSGKKVYVVAPQLRWMLENTELRKYPSEDLKPPHQALYIDMRGAEYKIYNEMTGWHPIEGVYVIEDRACTPKRWRLLVVGLANENSKRKDDDALYHWTIVFPEASTIEEALQYTVETSLSPDARDMVVDGKNITVDNAPVGGKQVQDRQRKIFEEMTPVLLSLFRYVMNVLLYSTLPDADIVFSDASREYRDLKSRLHKLPKKSSKRQKVLQRLNKMGPKPRIVLGGNIVIDRKKEASEKGSGTGRKHKVRTLVSGHWHHYWVGEGRKDKIRKWVSPFWRGPEMAPLTEKRTVLK